MADPYSTLSARERQVMDAVYQLGEATAAEVREGIPDPPTDATVRSTLRVLEDKGWLQHRRDGARFVYRPVEPRRRVRKRLLGHVMRTFFEGSPSEVMAALVESRGTLSAAEREQIRALLADLDESGS